MTSTLSNALNLARAGFRVFPLEPNSKRPMRGASWKRLATSDPAKIEKLWRDPLLGWESDWGVGIATGDGLVVIDIDVKNGGYESLKALEMLYDEIPRNVIVRTPSGGAHIYLTTDQPIANSAGKLGPGLDVRGEGGYVVAPGTEIDGKPYLRVATLEDARKDVA